MEARLNDREIKRIEAAMTNDHEAHELLDLINAEFQSDPTSTQCFDLRIVERVKWCVAQGISPVTSSPLTMPRNHAGP